MTEKQEKAVQLVLSNLQNGKISKDDAFALILALADADSGKCNMVFTPHVTSNTDGWTTTKTWGTSADTHNDDSKIILD